MALTELGLRPLGSAFADQSITSLSSGQAAGTSTVLAANTDRTALKIVPPIDCFLAVASGQTTGIPLYGEIENTFEGNGCPTNALYIVGLTAAAAVLIWES